MIRNDKKPNILSPTLRAKKRYIAYEIISESEIAFGTYELGYLQIRDLPPYSLNIYPSIFKRIVKIGCT